MRFLVVMTIMMHLIHSGIDPLFSFKTMEKVRKGKGLSEDDIKVMKDGGIPQWYIDSCLKIKYLFPRAHATAYVMMAYRIAFCKVHYPLAFYAAYFSIRAAEFDADIISKGKLAVRDKLDEIIELEKQKKLSVKDKGFQVVLELAWEMYLRGFSVEKVDLYKSNADKFILHENLYYRHLLPLLVLVLWLQIISFKLALKGNSLLLMTSKNVLVYLHQLLNACVNMVA